MKIFRLFVALTLIAIAISPMAQAVVPAPDGGYPGANTAEGTDALFSRTNGINNTAVGLHALFNDTSGSYNVGIGVHALALNTSGNFNMAIGTDALSNNTASSNVAVGFRALYLNTTGHNLTGVGANALHNNTTGSFNIAVGGAALNNNSTGGANTAVGYQTLNKNTVGTDNTATGYQALFRNTMGGDNTANGYQALYSNTTGIDNTGNGFQALFSNTTGFGNTANGAGALDSNTTGSGNTAIGEDALDQNNGDSNIAIGIFALSRNTVGSGNIGLNGGDRLTTGDFNIDIGNDGVAGESRTIRIGTAFFQTKTFITGIYNVNEGGTILPVYINSNGQLGTMSSSRRFKEEIKAMDKASEAILALKPMTFRYKKEIDPDGTPQFGLVAEDVAKVNPDLVARDADGKPYTVRYDAVNAMLLNEFLKEHKKVQQLQATVAQQQKDFQAAIAKLKEAVTAQLN